MGTAVRKIQRNVVNALRVYPSNPPLVVHLRPAIDMTEDEFFEFCRVNRDLRIERSAQGELIVMPPTVFETGDQNSEINFQLRQWAKRDGTGMTFDSSAGFTLPNGAVRSPDASWVKKARAKALTKEQRQRFAPLCPDFVIELRSKSDSLKVVKEKMLEYMENGAQLGFLLDPRTKRVHVYRPGRRVEVLENPKSVPADPVLPGFALDLSEIW